MRSGTRLLLASLLVLLAGGAVIAQGVGDFPPNPGAVIHRPVDRGPIADTDLSRTSPFAIVTTRP